MTKEKINYYVGQLYNVTEDDFVKRITFHETDDIQTVSQNLIPLLVKLGHESLVAWELFTDIFTDIPNKLKMPVMLEIFYSICKIDYVGLLQFIDEYVRMESADDKQFRINTNRKLLGSRIDADNNIMLYRGITEGSVMPDYAVSFATDKEVAEFFVKYHKERHESRFGVAVQGKCNIENVLYYTNEREEKEVFVIPRCVKEHFVPETEADIVNLGTAEMMDYYSWADDAEIAENIIDEELSGLL